MKHRKLWMRVLGVLCILLAVAFSVYPLVGNYLAEKNKSLVRTAYTETVENWMTRVTLWSQCVFWRGAKR